MSGGPGPGALSGLTPDELRAAVREVLRDVLPAAVTDRPGVDVPSPDPVVLRTDSDLDAFVRRVAALCDDPGRRAALQAGRHGFRLAGDPVPAGPAAAPAAGAAPGGVLRVERGAVTERTVKRAAADGARLLLGPRAVLTPLARDRARSLGVTVEKES